MPNIKILSGLPGSGKTTYRKEKFPNAIVCSADDFRLINGVYTFSKETAGAHDLCLEKFSNKLYEHRNDNVTIVVDNTNISLKSMDTYITLSYALGVDDIEIIRLVCTPEKSLSRNTHCVPKDTINKMYQNLVPIYKIVHHFPFVRYRIVNT